MRVLSLIRSWKDFHGVPHAGLPHACVGHSVDIVSVEPERLLVAAAQLVPHAPSPAGPRTARCAGCSRCCRAWRRRASRSPTPPRRRWTMSGGVTMKTTKLRRCLMRRGGGKSCWKSWTSASACGSSRARGSRRLVGPAPPRRRGGGGPTRRSAGAGGHSSVCRCPFRTRLHRRAVSAVGGLRPAECGAQYCE